MGGLSPCGYATDVTVLVDEASRNTSAIEGQDAQICARMLGMADFVIAGSFQTLAVADSAQEGVDFVASLQNFVLPALSAEPQCVAVPTVDDSIVEGREEFQAELAIDAAGNAKVALGDESTATIAIVDNDCELRVTLYNGHVMSHVMPPSPLQLWRSRLKRWITRSLRVKGKWRCVQSSQDV